MNSVIAKIADSIIRYRIALLTLYILFFSVLYLEEPSSLAKYYDL